MGEPGSIRGTERTGHSMSDLAKGMITNSGVNPLGHRDAWWKGRDNAAGKNCTDLFRNELKASCQQVHDGRYCPN